MMRSILKQFLSTPGMAEWWSEMKHDWFTDSFRTEVDAILADSEIKVRPFRRRSYDIAQRRQDAGT